MTTASDAGDGWRTENTYYYQADDDQPLSEAVVRAVSEVSDRSSVGTDDEEGSRPLDPLYESIDPDALDALFRDGANNPRTGTVEFPYCGYQVTVQGSGLVTVTER